MSKVGSDGTVLRSLKMITRNLYNVTPRIVITFKRTVKKNQVLIWGFQCSKLQANEKSFIGVHAVSYLGTLDSMFSAMQQLHDCKLPFPTLEGTVVQLVI
jgi:hypothetical protein